MKTFFVIIFVLVGGNCLEIKLPSLLPNGKPGNDGCQYNKVCSDFLANRFPELAQDFINTNYEVSQPDSIAIENSKVVFTDDFNVTLIKNVCSTYPTNASRRDTFKVQMDNYMLIMDLDLVELVKDFSTLNGIVGNIASTANDTVCDSPGVTGALNPILATPDLLSCLKAVKFPTSGRLNGTYQAHISNLQIDIDLTANKNGPWIVNYAGFAPDKIIFLNETCIGKDLFVPACQCIIKSSVFKNAITLFSEARYTCTYQYFIDQENTEIVKCQNYSP